MIFSPRITVVFDKTYFPDSDFTTVKDSQIELDSSQIELDNSKLSLIVLKLNLIILKLNLKWYSANASESNPESDMRRI